MTTVAIFYNKEKEKTTEASAALTQWLTANGYQFMLDDVRSTIGKQIKTADYIISLGGDGTTLRAARIASSYNIPILGVSLGTLGFLAEINLENLYEAIKKIEETAYHIDERTMLQMQIFEGEKMLDTAYALNEVVISSLKTKMLMLDVMVSGNYVTTYAADGLIISTPTGSTAYNLSAGGPVLSPKLDAMIITPICAHSLNLRSLVVRGQEQVMAKPHDPGHFKEAIISLDGQLDFNLQPNQVVKVSKARKSIKFIRFDDFCFFDALRSKLKWSGKSH